MRILLVTFVIGCTVASPATAFPPPPPPPPSWEGGVTDALFSHDGKHILTYTGGYVIGTGRLKLWDVSKEQTPKGEQKALAWSILPFGDKDVLAAMAFSPDGEQVLAVNRGGGKTELRKFRVSDGKEVQRLPLPALSRVTFTAGGDAVAGVTEKDRKACLWATKGVKLLCQIPFDPGHTDLHPSPNGARLLSWSSDGRLTEWDFKTGRKLRELTPGGRKGYFTSASYFPKIDRILVNGDEPGWRMIEDSTGKSKELPRPLRDISRSKRIVFSPDGKKALTTSAGDVVHDAVTGKESHRLPKTNVLERTFDGKPSGVSGVVRFSPDSKTLLIAGFAWGPRDFAKAETWKLQGDRTALLLWDLENGKMLRTLAFPAAP